MRVLVLYTLRSKITRKTITEHLFSFEKYSPKNKFIYVNVDSNGIPSYLKKIDFDAIILHYTFLAGERFFPGKAWENKVKGLSELKGFKIAIPQDEYSYTNRLVNLFREIDVDIVYTCFYKPDDIELAYGQYLPKKVKYVPVFTGYIDEKLIEEIKSYIRPYSERKIDIGYRASMLPAHLGKHGQLKFELISEFNQRLINSSLILDIKSSNTILSYQNSKLIKLGNKWNDFLLSCKAFIGSEGGASLLDFDGEIQKKVSAYTEKHPKASFAEIESVCFPGMDYNISCFAISPRHFEAVMTKTLQILVEGYYGGIFKPGIHYVELKKDYSNFNQVIAQLSDEQKCQEIIDNAYNDIALSGEFTYRNFVNKIIGDIDSKRVKIKPSFIQSLLISVLKLRESYLLFSYKVYDTLMYPYNVLYQYYYRFIRPHVRK